MINLDKIYKQLQSDWQRSMARFGVPQLPVLDHSKHNTRLLQLIYLRARMGEACEKNDVGRFVQVYVPGASLDQQVRHWKRDGWNVQGRGGVDGSGRKLPASHYCLIPGISPEFMSQRTRDLGRVAVTDWESLKDLYEHKCGVCGAANVPLEQGHLDPRKELTIDNMIPICNSCNLWQLNRFVLNENGRPVAVLPSDSTSTLFRGLDKRERAAIKNLIDAA